MKNAKIEVTALFLDERSQELQDLGINISNTGYFRMVIDIADVSTFSETAEGNTILIMNNFDSYEINMTYDRFFEIYQRKSGTKIERCVPNA